MAILQVAVALVLGGLAASADTVYFNDADRASADSLQIGDVTISEPGGGGRPATLNGSGLGSDGGIGSTSEWLAQYHYSAGSASPDSFINEGDLRLDVNGTINSITVLPVFRVYDSLGAVLPDELKFELSADFYDPNPPGPPGPGYKNFNPATGSDITLFPQSGFEPDSITFSWATDFPNSLGFFGGYRADHQSEEQTFQWGLIIESLDYTPAPEPGFAAFAAAGLAAFLCIRRKQVRR